MNELHKFLFEGLPVRGMLVRLTDSWQTLLARRSEGETLDAPVRKLLGEMTAAGVLMQSNIKFNGAVVLQVFGDGPVKLAVTEVQPDLSFRSTAKVVGELPGTDDGRLPLEVMVNVGGGGRCAITLDPKDRLPGQQPYQGVVPLHGDHGEPLHQLSAVLEHYMLQSEQLDTRLVLAANDQVAAGLLIQRLPVEGEGNLAGSQRNEDEIGVNEHFNRIAHLAATLKQEELLTLDVDTILRRLFWEEDVRRFEPQAGPTGPRFACTCSRERVANMLRSLGVEEIESIIAEQGQVDIGCDFCGAHYLFDPVDAANLFTGGADSPTSSGSQQLAPGPQARADAPSATHGSLSSRWVQSGLRMADSGSSGCQGERTVRGSPVMGCTSDSAAACSHRRGPPSRSAHQRLCAPLPCVASPMMGCDRCLRCRRIWWRRPVSGSASTKATRVLG